MGTLTQAIPYQEYKHGILLKRIVDQTVNGGTFVDYNNPLAILYGTNSIRLTEINPLSKLEIGEEKIDIYSSSPYFFQEDDRIVLEENINAKEYTKANSRLIKEKGIFLDANIDIRTSSTVNPEEYAVKILRLE